jgi:uncharacterized protein with PQ loop repeat
MIWLFVVLFLWIAILALCIWLIVDGLRNGVVRAKLGSYSRSKNPICFWLCIAMYAGLVAWVLYLTALAFITWQKT